MSTLAALPFGRTRSNENSGGRAADAGSEWPNRSWRKRRECFTDAKGSRFLRPVAIAIPTLVRDIAAIAVHLTNGAGWRGADKSVDVFLGDRHTAAEPERTAGHF